MARIIAIMSAALGLAVSAAAPAIAHEGDPNFESVVTRTGPTGLQARVLSGDDRLELRNATGKLVIVEGYDQEPYARLLADGRVQVNVRSPATYLNEESRGNVVVPDVADPRAAPEWKTVDGNGRFEFHDHRIHWMADGDPPVVLENRAERQEVFDWSVPVTVGDQEATIDGTLWWRGTGGGPPVAAIVALAVVAAGSVVLVAVVRRRRARGEGGDEPSAPKPEPS